MPLYSEAGEVPRYFATKADYELHQANRPDEVDLAALAQYWEWNRRISTQFHGAFGGYRAGLVDPPSLSLKQSLRNLLSRSQAKRLLRGETFDRKLRALKKFHNFKVATKRATSDPEGEILDGILSVVGGDTTGWVEVVGLRLLDGYFKREGYRSEGRVILGSPLYLASAYERW